jgi:hypothetical protein
MEQLTLEKMIDRCDMYRSLFKSAHAFRKQEYYEQWQHYKNLLSQHAKDNVYKVQLYFKQPTTPFVPMSDWTERYEEYGY